MEVADVGFHLGDNLAVGPKHEPQHAMGARMLRPHVDQHLVGADVELDDPRVVVEQVCHRYLPLMPW